MPLQETKEHIREFLVPRLGDRDLDDDDDIFALGYVNSLFAMQLVTFVEQRFDIVVEPEDLDFDNFRTIERLAALVEAKTAIAT